MFAEAEERFEQPGLLSIVSIYPDRLVEDRSSAGFGHTAAPSRLVSLYSPATLQAALPMIM